MHDYHQSTWTLSNMGNTKIPGNTQLYLRVPGCWELLTQESLGLTDPLALFSCPRHLLQDFFFFPVVKNIKQKVWSDIQVHSTSMTLIFSTLILIMRKTWCAFSCRAVNSKKNDSRSCPSACMGGPSIIKRLEKLSVHQCHTLRVWPLVDFSFSFCHNRDKLDKLKTLSISTLRILHTSRNYKSFVTFFFKIILATLWRKSFNCWAHESKLQCPLSWVNCREGVAHVTSHKTYSYKSLLTA